MSALTVESGKKAAEAMVGYQQAAYTTANRTFGGYLIPLLFDCPVGISIAHILSVNPSLKVKPDIHRDQRRGFMLATIDMAQKLEIPWAQLDDPKTCAFVWCTDINDSAIYLYTNYKDLFTGPDEDFWGTAYMRHRLSSDTFKELWTLRDATKSSVFESLLYAAESVNRSLAGMPVYQFKQTVLRDCVFVVKMAKRAGNVRSKGWGMRPVLDRQGMLDIFGI